MRLTFLGTRTNIEERTAVHPRHAALLVEHKVQRVLIDCGRDWLGRLKRLEVDAIVVTHAHSDHAFGLASGAACPVYATKAIWDCIDRYPIVDRHVLRVGKPSDVCGIAFDPFAVEHSLRAPAVGFRLSDGKRAAFYCPDLVRIRGCHAALAGVAAYIGDGSAISRPILKKRSGSLIGHESIRTQLAWRRKEGTPRAIFTHCGSSLKKVDEFMHISRRMRFIALESAVGGIALSIIGMAFAASGHLSPVSGAISQEVIDILAVLNALRAAFPPKVIHDL